MPDKLKIESLIHELLVAIGENPERDGLKTTPERVAHMYAELFSGVNSLPDENIKIFKEDENQNDLIIIKDIPVYSMCEHHLLPFVGEAHIRYIPKNGQIMGLSKFARIVDCFARRPQVQERLTSQIADFIFSKLNPQGVEVVIEAEHLCMTMRGIKSHGSKTKTIATRGALEN